MTAETRDHLTSVAPATPTVVSILSSHLERLAASEAREAAARLNLGRSEEWCRWHEAQALVYERRLGALLGEQAHLADRAHRAERDRWLAALVASVICLLVIGFCAWALVTR